MAEQTEEEYQEICRKVWSELERRAWNGSDLLYAESINLYMDREHIGILVEDRDIDLTAEGIEELRLRICAPNMATDIDLAVEWEDLIDADEGVPYELEAAIHEFNEKVRAYGKPLSWSYSRYVPTLESLLGVLAKEIAEVQE